MREFLEKLFWPIAAPINFIQNHFKATIFVAVLFFIFYSSGEENIAQPNLAKIHLSGPIFSADKFMEQLKEAQDKKVKGILLIIDSPGGAVAPSVEISMAVKRVQKTIPVVAYASGAMASGSYYSGIWANKIIANPGAIIGSIGVVFEGANVEGLLKKLGIQTQVVKAGEYKETGTPFRAWTQKEREELQNVIGDTYKMFVEDVAAARKLDPAKKELFADAHVFTPRMAKEVGLVDSLGTIFDAEDAIVKLSGVKEPVWMERSRMDKLMERFADEAAMRISSHLFGLKAY